MMVKKLKVGVAGLGTVGLQTVCQLLKNREQIIQKAGVELALTAVADPQIDSDRKAMLDNQSCYSDAADMVEQEELDLLVELIGGVDPAGKIIHQALNRGIDVVTANKELLAKQGSSFFELSRKGEGRLRFEAAVGGSIPIIRTIREALVGVELDSIYGIINGTTNYILSCMADRGLEFDKALQEARHKGFAEADPTADVEGFDSAHKMTILAELAFGINISPDAVYTEGIKGITPMILEDARQLGYSIKLLGIAKKFNHRVDVRVHPTLIPQKSALAAVTGEYNAVYLKGSQLGSSMLYGKGAGGPSTATAVISDLVSLAAQKTNSTPAVYYSWEKTRLLPTEQLVSCYYLRLSAVDRPGVLARVTEILGRHHISIETVIQRGRSADRLVPVVLTTHEAREGAMQAALEEISQLEDIGQTPKFVRIEEGFEQE